MNKLSIVIPCYNEEKNIEPLFKKIEEIINLDESLEIIIVDNGSTDDTKKTFILLTYTKREKLKFMKLKKTLVMVMV